MNKTVKGTSLVAGGILLGAIGVTAFRFLTKMRNNKIDLSKDGLGGSASVSPFDKKEGDTVGDFDVLDGFDVFCDSCDFRGSVSVSPFGVGEEDTLGGFVENLDGFSSPDSFDLNGGSNLDDLHGDSYAEGKAPFFEDIKEDMGGGCEELYEEDYEDEFEDA